MALGSTNMPDLRTRLTLDISDFTTGLVHARGEARLFSREIEGVGGHFRAAGVAMATFATVSVFTAGIIGTAFMGAIGVLMTLGVVSAFQAESVQVAWTQTGEHLRQGMLAAARSYVPVLERLAAKTRTMFDEVQPAITAVFDRLAPIFEDLSVSFMGWFSDLILEMPSMVNSAIAFLQEIGPAWDAMTDNMRVGWNEMYAAVLEFGPTILLEGLPPFGIFVGSILSMLGSVVESAASLSGPFFTALAEVGTAAKFAFADVLSQITPELALFGATLSDLGLGLVDLLSGAGPGLSALIAELRNLGPIVADVFRGLEPSLGHLLGVTADMGAALMPVAAAFGQFLVQLGPVLVAFGHLAVAMASGFVEGIQPLLEAMGYSGWSDAMVDGIEAITPGMRELSKLFGEFVTIVVFGGGAILNAFSMIVGGLASMAGIFGSLGENAGRALVVGIIAGIGFMFSPLIGVVAGLIAAVSMFRGSSAPAPSPPPPMLPPMPAAPGTPGSPAPMPTSGAASVTNVNVNVEGSVLSERELQTVVQDAALQQESRNAGSTFATSVRS